MKRPTIATLAFAAAVSSCSSCSRSPSPKHIPQSEATVATDDTAAVECSNPFADSGPLRFETRGWETDFCKHSVPYAEIRGGGPPRDGIPPIDEPSFVSIDEADEWLEDREPVIAVSIDGQAKAYPLQIMTWHEVVNDDLGGVPIAVTFCPLCYAAIVFERPEVGGERLTFGTSGNLRNSDLVMWDRQTESWWQQFEGRAIVGKLTGKKLDKIAAAILSWAQLKELHPRSTVLSKDTGFDRRYGNNPYVGYDDIDNKPFLYEGKVGDALAPMARIIGVEIDDARRAYPADLVEKRGVVNDELGGVAITLWHQGGVASAVDEASIAASRDIGTTSVFVARSGDRPLTFERRGGTVTDRETGSTWDMAGRAIRGPLKGQELEALPSHQVFWFVWSAFAHEGDLYSD